MNVRIRPLEENDAYTSVKWRNMPEVWKYTEYKWTREITLEDELQWIRRVVKDLSCSRFAILADDTYVGNVYLTNIKDGVAEYSIFIGNKEYWGKGVARKASEQIIAYGRDVLHLSAITLRIREDNLAAMHIYLSLGFTRMDKKDEVFTWMKLDL